MRVLPSDQRRTYLPRLMIRNHDSWRHRAGLAHVCPDLAPLFELSDAAHLMLPFLLSMAADKVFVNYLHFPSFKVSTGYLDRLSTEYLGRLSTEYQC